MKDEVICDKLVIGIRDESLSESLQMEAELTLDKAKQFIRQRVQQAALKSPPIQEETSLDSVTSRAQTTSITPQAMRQVT